MNYHRFVEQRMTNRLNEDPYLKILLMWFDRILFYYLLILLHSFYSHEEGIQIVNMDVPTQY